MLCLVAAATAINGNSPFPHGRQNLSLTPLWEQSKPLMPVGLPEEGETGPEEEGELMVATVRNQSAPAHSIPVAASTANDANSSDRYYLISFLILQSYCGRSY